MQTSLHSCFTFGIVELAQLDNDVPGLLQENDVKFWVIFLLPVQNKLPLNASVPQSVFVKHLIGLCWHEELVLPGFRQISSVHTLLSPHSVLLKQVIGLCLHSEFIVPGSRQTSWVLIFWSSQSLSL